jgi:hypothetical protein
MFAVKPSLYLESKLRTNSASASGQTPPKQIVIPIHAGTSSQQLAPNKTSSPLDKNSQNRPTKIHSGI